MNFLGWVKGVVGLGLSVFGFIKGPGTKPSFTDVLPLVLGNILPAIEKAITYGNLSTKEQLDAWLDTIDAGTGTDPGAVDLIKNLPADQEEAFFDHMKEAARIYGYCLLKVPGYHQE